MITYRALDDTDFPQLYQATLEAFADYAVPYLPTLDALQRMFLINNVRFELSVGAFDGEKMIGFIVNAIGVWNGRRTVYNSGTGTLPAYRRQGISRRMFDFTLPTFKKHHAEQYLLEVISENEAALRLYRNLGFETTRRLLVYKRQEALTFPEKSDAAAAVKEIETLDWELFESFWTYVPAWQNSTDAIKRILGEKKSLKTFVGLYVAEKLVGYGVVFHNSGNVPQIAVAAAHQGKGFGRRLLNALQNQTKTPLLISNVDAEAVGAAGFFEANGFSILTTQNEMLLKL